MVIDKYTKSSVSHHTTSEVGTFDQSDGDSNKHIPQYDLKYWNNMQCFRCLHKGLPALHCTKIIINTNGYKQSDDGKSKFSKSSNSRKNNKAESMTKIQNYQIEIKSSFTTFNAILEEMGNEDSGLTSSDYDGGKSHISSLRKQTGSKACTKPQ